MRRKVANERKMAMTVAATANPSITIHCLQLLFTIHHSPFTTHHSPPQSCILLRSCLYAEFHSSAYPSAIPFHLSFLSIHPVSFYRTLRNSVRFLIFFSPRTEGWIASAYAGVMLGNFLEGGRRGVVHCWCSFDFVDDRYGI